MASPLAVSLLNCRALIQIDQRIVGDILARVEDAPYDHGVFVERVVDPVAFHEHAAVIACENEVMLPREKAHAG